jgi:hypothetical protein
MRLSDFKTTNYAKKLQYANGVPTLVEYDKLDGDINFYSIDENVISKIGSELLPQIASDDKDELFMYMLIPYLCDVEVDVTFEQFEEMLKSTNKNFLSFVEVILNLINDGISMASSVEKIESVTKSITEKTNIIVETDEDKLQRLYNEYGEAKNRNEKRRLMREIESLEEKIDKNAN